MTDHRYPMHTHAAWTLLIVDDGTWTGTSTACCGAR